MTVDFAFKKAPAMRVATVSWKGAWNEGRIRKEFEGLARWVRAHKVRTGKWVFMEPGEAAWTVAIELRGNAKGDGKVRIRTLSASRVAAVAFDPKLVSPRVVYHGLSDWLRWRKKDGDIKRVLSSREVYSGNPWKDAAAWAHTEVQFVVR
ncbi:MAG TPA: GyrI-like domain-containing protein [Thermoplasmata archaeon]|nr:GyrI-like domain-containing protein [Thermoplasmata archaeon]